MPINDGDSNPLLNESPSAWNDLIEAAGPAGLLVAIESRLSPTLRRHTTPEDVLQEALLHAWRDRHLCEWRGLKSFRSWLLTIIDHRIGHLVAASATQKRGAGVAVANFSAFSAAAGSDSGSAFPGPVGSTTPSRVAIYREQAAAIHDALAALPPEFAEVVRLRLFEQITLAEIAARLDLGLSVVRRRFGRGAELYETALRQALASRSQQAASAGSGPTDDP
jgi:RNA polymerase sigma-70 factor (ECF subfamily)